MINGQRVLALIPARGGSKGLPGKNIRPLRGKPLILWSVDHARNCVLVDHIVVSTDCDEITGVCEQNEVAVVRRPDELASDSALVADAIDHALGECERSGLNFDIAVLLQPTSPLRPLGLITKCIEALIKEELSSIATFSELPISAQRIWTLTEGVPQTILDGNPWLPRQALDKTFYINGLMYVFRVDEFRKSSDPSVLFGRKRAYVTAAYPDIDTLEDFEAAERMLLETE